ncbi:MAG: T9SS type A sorting domain-containing protein [Cytophagaceae bacterium]|nr:T9SS type A sorting domain-containing protein [Cytophagaceae bacterium]
MNAFLRISILLLVSLWCSLQAQCLLPASPVPTGTVTINSPLQSGQVGQFYRDTIQIAIPYSLTAYASYLVTGALFQANNQVTGIPSGLSLQFNPAPNISNQVSTTVAQPHGGYICAILSGTPATSGNFYIAIDLSVQMTLLSNSNISNTQTIYLETLVHIDPATTGVYSTSEVSSIQVFPNPATDMLHLRFHEPHTSTWEIINGNGASVHSGTFINQADIALQQLVPGYYYILVKSENGIFTKGFSKQ